jgi:molecular chaperone GrpE
MMKLGEELSKLARFARMGNNREGTTDSMGSEGSNLTNDSRSDEQMQDQNAGHEAQEPEMVTGDEFPQERGFDAAPETTALQGELDQMKLERDQLLDRLARLQAEFDNARKREIRERADARDYTITSTVEPFLGVMDNFQLALRADGTVEQLRSGVELILKQMEEALRSLNVQPVESVGEQFDPRIHEALGSIETKEFPDHQVLEEIRRGYRIREKLLRPALVRIAENPDQVSD